MTTAQHVCCVPASPGKEALSGIYMLLGVLCKAWLREKNNSLPA